MTLHSFPTDVISAVSTVVAGAGHLDPAASTPCSEFDLTTLVNHVAGTTAALARAGRRQPLDPDDPYGTHRDNVGEDWQGRLTSNLQELGRAWADRQAWEGSVDLGGQTMPAPMVGELALAEVVLHGWDLARASGQALAISPETAAVLRRSIDETGGLGRQLGAYGPQVHLAADATDFDRALAGSGRDPAWVPG